MTEQELNEQFEKEAYARHEFICEQLKLPLIPREEFLRKLEDGTYAADTMHAAWWAWETCFQLNKEKLSG